MFVSTAAKCAQLERGQSAGDGCCDAGVGYLEGCLNKSFFLRVAGGLGGSLFTAISCRSYASLHYTRRPTLNHYVYRKKQPEIFPPNISTGIEVHLTRLSVHTTALSSHLLRYLPHVFPS